jgi:hypothetical protein
MLQWKTKNFLVMSVFSKRRAGFAMAHNDGTPKGVTWINAISNALNSVSNTITSLTKKGTSTTGDPLANVPPKNNTFLWICVGAGVLLIGGLLFWVIRRKK